MCAIFSHLIMRSCDYAHFPDFPNCESHLARDVQQPPRVRCHPGCRGVTQALDGQKAVVDLRRAAALKKPSGRRGLHKRFSLLPPPPPLPSRTNHVAAGGTPVPPFSLLLPLLVPGAGRGACRARPLSASQNLTPVRRRDVPSQYGGKDETCPVSTVGKGGARTRPRRSTWCCTASARRRTPALRTKKTRRPQAPRGAFDGPASELQRLNAGARAPGNTARRAPPAALRNRARGAGPAGGAGGSEAVRDAACPISTG